MSSIEDRLAALEAAQADANEAANTTWLLLTGSLVFFMQSGFCMLEAGAVRSRATQTIMLKNLFDVSLGSMLWWLLGYGFVNGAGNAFIGVEGSFFATESLTSAAVTETSGVEFALFFHSFTFAAAAATIVSGAVAERAQLPAYVVFSSLMTAFICARGASNPRPALALDPRARPPAAAAQTRSWRTGSGPTRAG